MAGGGEGRTQPWLSSASQAAPGVRLEATPAGGLTLTRARSRPCPEASTDGAVNSRAVHPGLRACVTPPPSLPYPSNKPNPNQISVNNVKAGVVNGAWATRPGALGPGRACESCYRRSQAHPSPRALGTPAPSRDRPGAGVALAGRSPDGEQGEPCPGPGGVGGRQLWNALCRHWFCLRIRLHFQLCCPSHPVLPVVFLVPLTCSVACDLVGHIGRNMVA